MNERMYKKVSANVNQQFREIMVKAYEDVSYEEKVVLSPERNRLHYKITKMVMDDMLKRFEGGMSSS